MTTSTLWRSHLKKEEAERVDFLDERIENHRAQATDYTAEREIIRRRAVGRIRLAAAKNV